MHGLAVFGNDGGFFNCLVYDVLFIGNSFYEMLFIRALKTNFNVQSDSMLKYFHNLRTLLC